MKKIKSEKGLLSLEASITLTIFIFLMLFMYSYMVVFEARNVMAHALLSATDSLSLDTYELGKLQESGDISQILVGIYNTVTSADNEFHSTDRWNQVTGVDEASWDKTIHVSGSGIKTDEFGNSGVQSDTLGQVIKERFFAYLAASDDEDDINAVLDKYHILGGIDGIDFSGSRIQSGNIYIEITYSLDYEFNVFDILDIKFNQSACSKLWK